MMKKTKKMLTVLLAALCVTGTASVMSSCSVVDGIVSKIESLFGEDTKEATIEFTENFPAHLTQNVSVDISQYVKHEKGQSLTMTAEYTDANGEKKAYETFGTSFMPTELGEVTITVTLKDTDISITKTVPVKISAPKVLSSQTVIRYRDEEFELDSLKEGLNILAPNDEYTFKAVRVNLIGSEEVVDLSGLTAYTFTEAGIYSLKYEVYNDGGSTDGLLLVYVKRALTENEKDDISNYGEGVVAQSSGKVTVDEEDTAENSDWSFAIWADSNATGVSVFDTAPNYWTNYGMLELEGGIDLSQYYLEFDVKFSKDARDVLSIRMVDETQTTTSGEKLVNREGEADENGEYAWQHVSMKDMYKYGTYRYIRFLVMHPLTADSSTYDVNNVFVKIDNVRLCKYDVPYEYHEAVNYVKTDADYTAAEGDFEEKVTLWENMDDDGVPTYLAQDGEYVNEVTEYNFTVENADIDGYRFVLGARVSEAGSYDEGVYLDFRRDAGGAFFAVYAPEGLKSGNNIDAQLCYFTSGHNYTATIGVIDNTLKLIIYDNTAAQTLLDYELNLEGVTLPEKGGFGFWTYGNVEVACKKPYTYVEVQDAAEVTLSDYSFGANNSKDRIDLVFGSGALQKAIVNCESDLSRGEGTFGTLSTWNEDQFPGMVGALANSATTLMIFPSGRAAAVGDKITVPAGATIIVEGYTAIFGEALEIWYNGESWQTEYVEPEQPDEDPDEDPNAVTAVTLTKFDTGRSAYANGMYQLYFEMNIQQNGATWGGWDNSASVTLNGEAMKADGWCFASDVLLYVQVTTANIANPLTVAKGTSLVINGKNYEIAEDISVYYYDGAWQNEAKVEPKEATISDFSLSATTNYNNQVDVLIGNGQIPTAIISGGNLSAAGGNFGTAATYNENGFYGVVGVLAADATTFNFFPPSDQAAAGDKITVPEGTNITVGEFTVTFGETLEMWYNGESWQTTEYVAPEQPDEDPNVATAVTLTKFDTGRSAYANGMYQLYFEMNIQQNGATWGGWDNSASVMLNGEAKVADGWCFASDVLLYVQVTTADIANPLTIAKGTSLVINGENYEIAEDISVYYYDGAWQTAEYVDPEQPEEPEEPEVTATTISGFSIGTTNGGTHVVINVGAGAFPTDFPEGDIRVIDGNFVTDTVYAEGSFAGQVGITASGTTMNFFPATATLGDKLMIPQGKVITYNTAGDTVTFGEKLEIWYNGTGWQMTEPVVISDFSFGTNNGADRFDLVFGSGTLPADFVTYATENNLSSAEGTFGQVSTWNEDKFPGYVGVLASSSAKYLKIFPSNHTATVGEVITIPEGATIIAAGYTVVFGEEVKVTFNGTAWEGLGEDEPDPTTALTITSLDTTRTVYTNGTYQIYFYTDITNNGASWGGWDNSTNVSLNGTETRADWCFANTGANALLYVQITTTETANPLTIAKGTILTINDIRYEITEDFSVYYYDGAFYTEPQA